MKKILANQIFLSAFGKVKRWKRALKTLDDPSYNRLYLKSRNLKRNLEGKQFNFVTVDQTTIWTREWIKTFPEKYDLIVGIPRSGMLIASIIALKLGKGLTTPELFMEGKFWLSNHVKDKLAWDEIKHVLLVDDAVDTGRSMSAAMDSIRSAGRNTIVTKASLIVHKKNLSTVDLHHKILAHPRAYEWNILHRKIASYWGHGMLGVDMDGVLCADCPPGVDQDEERYGKWLSAVSPYLIPSFEIDFILSNRLEKYREATEDWLQKHKVKYKQLYLWDIPDKRDRNGKFANHKIEELLRLKPDMFWESSWAQAQAIWAKTKIPTLCIDDMTLLS